ncbi:hypothetical protein BOTBODRAFT_180245 [Botryobasidium botryosum FD-172 SS1]|uniref:Uncharacterized protein n=1 Tax=Botryobasidium botryosum (strain FD-172 SS1) TaxID=930990 RepID=A0A067M8V1_BOTB1|nr:hypothetical protein BOTBODRAFT_180245 [Botryobasidium botryosum FD-172 SS1]
MAHSSNKSHHPIFHPPSQAPPAFRKNVGPVPPCVQRLLAKAKHANSAQQPDNLPKNKESNIMLSLRNATALLHTKNEFRSKDVETLGKSFQVAGTDRAPPAALVGKDEDKSEETETFEVQGIPESNKWGLRYYNVHDKIVDPDAEEECTKPKVFRIEGIPESDRWGLRYFSYHDETDDESTNAIPPAPKPAPAPVPIKTGVYWIDGEIPASFEPSASSKPACSRFVKSEKEVLESKRRAEALKREAEEERKRKEFEQQERGNKERAEKEQRECAEREHQMQMECERIAHEEHERQRRDAQAHLVARFRHAYAQEEEMKQRGKIVFHPPIWCPSTGWGCYPCDTVLPPPVYIPPVSNIEPIIAPVQPIQAPSNCTPFNSAPIPTTSVNPFNKFISLPRPAPLNIAGPAAYRPASVMPAIAPSNVAATRA